METSGCCDKPARLRYYEWDAAPPDDDHHHRRRHRHRPIDIKFDFRSSESGFWLFISPSESGLISAYHNAIILLFSTFSVALKLGKQKRLDQKTSDLDLEHKKYFNKLVLVLVWSLSSVSSSSSPQSSSSGGCCFCLLFFRIVVVAS